MRSLLVAVALVVLVGCGGSGSGFSSASEVAEAAGCSAPKTVSARDREFFVTSAVRCTIGGAVVLVNWFDSSSDRDSYKRTADGIGSPNLAYGDDWAVGCYEGRAGCDAFLEAMSER